VSLLMSLPTVVAALVVAAGDAQPTPDASPQQSVIQDSTYGCIVCHADKRRAFAQGAHAERGIRCHDCHGGDPAQYEVAPAHRGRFLGSPTKLETVRLCMSCHSDPDQMRQYGLPADQLAEFRTSRHGHLLLEQGNTDAPTCTDCHEAHTIRPANDARSMVFPSNIPGTCAHCHENRDVMAKYDLPTDQLSLYKEGAHGRAIFETRNFAAPTCIGCHGSHAALPPAVTEIAHVCGNCHALMAEAFYAGPHGGPSLEGQLPGCLACHTSHGTVRIPSEEIVSLCGGCHSGDDGVAGRAAEIVEQLQRAQAELAAAREAIDEMTATGRSVADEEFRYLSAYTAYREFARAQHSLDLDELEELGRQVRSNTGIINSTAEVYAEERWEHKLILVPVWFLTLSAVALAWFKLRELRR
jgi:hypothetical protein